MDESPPAPPPVQIHHPLCVTVLFKQLSLLKCYTERGGARLLFHLEVSDDGNQTLSFLTDKIPETFGGRWKNMFVPMNVCAQRCHPTFLTSRERSGFYWF